MEILPYFSKFDLLQTASLVLAASVIGVSPVNAKIEADCVGESYHIARPALYNDTAVFYLEANHFDSEDEQIAALQDFASKLLTNSVESPVQAVDLLNRHFWDLI